MAVRQKARPRDACAPRVVQHNSQRNQRVGESQHMSFRLTGMDSIWNSLYPALSFLNGSAANVLLIKSFSEVFCSQIEFSIMLRSMIPYSGAHERSVRSLQDPELPFPEDGSSFRA